MANSKVPNIFAHKRREAAYARASQSARGCGAAKWLLDEISADIVERVDFMRIEPNSALVVGLGTQPVQEKLTSKDCNVDLRLKLDDEQPISGGPFDFIASVNRLGTVNDLPGALLHMRNALVDGGVVIASLVGAGSLPTLRKIMLAADSERPAARIHPQIDNRAGSALLERAGFKRHVVDSAQIKASYTSLDRLITDLREQALTNVLADPPPPISKAGLARAKGEFDRLRDSEGRVTETFEILTLTGWA